MLLNAIFMIVPVALLVLSVVIATNNFKKKGNAKRSLLLQLASFGAVLSLCLVFPLVVGAAGGDPAPVADASAKGMQYLGAALSTGIACIGGGIAVGHGAPAAIGAAAEDPKNFGKAIIFVALGEGIALYGMLISILILNG